MGGGAHEGETWENEMFSTSTEYAIVFRQLREIFETQAQNKLTSK